MIYLPLQYLLLLNQQEPLPELEQQELVFRAFEPRKVFALLTKLCILFTYYFDYKLHIEVRCTTNLVTVQ